MSNLKELLTNMLSSDKNVRKQAEEALAENEVVDKIFGHFVDLIKIAEDQNEETHIRIAASVLASKIVGKPNFLSPFHKKGNEAQELQNLAKVLFEETNRTIYNKLISCFVKFLEKMHQFMPFMESLQGTALKEKPDYADKIVEIFTQYNDLGTGDFDPQYAKIPLSVIFPDCSKEGKRKALKLLILIPEYATEALGQQLELAQELLEETDFSELSTMFEDMEESLLEDKKAFNKHSKAIFALIKKIFAVDDTVDESQCKASAASFIAAYSEVAPAKFKKDAALSKEVIQMLMKRMTELITDPDDEWKKAEETVYQDYEAFLEALDRFLNALTESKALNYLTAASGPYFGRSSTWQQNYVGLLSFSQVGEYVESPLPLNDATQFAITSLQNENPKVRYAALHYIGQVADNLNPSFSETHGSVILPKLIGMFNDSVPRVQSHVFACLTNFVEYAPGNLVAQYIEKIIDPCIKLIDQGPKMTKENALAALSALAESAKKEFIPYWEKVHNVVFDLLCSLTDEGERQLRGQTVECLTLVSSSIGKEVYGSKIQALADKMMEIYNQQTDFTSENPLIDYLVAGWARLADTMGSDFSQYIDTALPAIIKSIEQSYEQSKPIHIEGVDMEDVHMNTNFEVLQQSFTALANIFENSDERGLQYIEATMNAIKKNETSSFISELAEPACNAVAYSMGCFLRHVKDASKIALVIPQVLTFLHDVQEKQSDYKQKYFVQKAMHTIFKSFQIEAFNSQQIGGFIDYFLKSFEKAHQEYQTVLGADGEDDEEYAEDDDENPELEDIQDYGLLCMETIGAIFKSHKQTCKGMVANVFNIVVPPLMATEDTNRQKGAGFLICDIIETYEFSEWQQYASSIAEWLQKMVAGETADIIQMGSFGLGVMAQRIPNDDFIDFSLPFLGKLNAAMKKVEEWDIKEEENAYCRENIISAVGKILRFQAKILPNFQSVLATWLKNMPLETDEEESQLSIANLCAVIENHFNEVFKNNENLGRVLNALASVYSKSFSNAEVDKQIQKVLGEISTHEKTAEQFKEEVEKLGNEKKELILYKILEKND